MNCVNHDSPARARWAALIPPLCALCEGGAEQPLRRAMAGKAEALDSLDAKQRRQLKQLFRALDGPLPTTKEAAAALLHAQRALLAPLCSLCAACGSAELLLALAKLPGAPNADSLLQLVRAQRRLEAQHAYCGELLWLIAALLNAMAVGTGFQVPDWFRLFGEGGQARHSPAEGGEDSESRKILRALAGQVNGDE